MAGDWYENYVLSVATATDYLTNTIKVICCTSEYVPDTINDTLLADITHEVSGDGYARKTLAGKTITIITDDDNRYVLFDADNLTWSLATFTAEQLVVYDDTATDKPVICFHDFGSDKTGGGGDFVYSFTDAGGVARIKL